MKYAKTAAVVAGSVAALGAAAPAFAATTPTAPRISLTTGVNELTSAAPRIPDQVVDPLVDAAGETVGAVQEDRTVSRSADVVTGVADTAAPLLGGLPLGG
ncbi:hypothetical protein ACIRJR_18655 [Streptomyces sp. NPDC102402]|uniref:hypothetical protein n=1 Tax=Streptomyces sp. NPDC102402 TaxID=3366169 RepID=UPI0037FBD0C4